jgi:hypothetical protein
MRDDAEHQQFVDGKRQRRMAEIDRQPPAIRKLTHDYGWYVVKNFMDLGITKPNHIRHLVEVVLNEFSPTRGTFSQQGLRGELIDPKVSKLTGESRD